MDECCSICSVKQKDGCDLTKVSKGLISAVNKGHLECAKLLLKAGANVNIFNRGEPVIIGAASNGYFKIVNLLIQAGANVNVSNSYGITALIGASCFGHDKCVRSLLHSGADVNATGRNNSTALIAAAVMGKSDCVALLIAAGADVNARDITGNTVLFEAAFSNNLTCVQLLLKSGARINEFNNDDLNALKYNLVQGKTEEEDVPMFLFAAGEILDVTTVERTDYWGNVTHVEVPDYLKLTELNLCLKHLCREAIRKHFIRLNPHSHLFNRIPRLGLPPSVTYYVLYGQSLPDE